MRINLSEIVFEEDSKDITKVQLLRAGKYNYYGEKMTIEPKDLKNMKKNFDDNIKKVDLMIDYYHNSFSDAAGWIKNIILENKDTELWVEMEWTEKGKEKILSKELRYLSADFDFNYVDNETNEEFGITLNGGGLTNRPFVKGMEAILSDIDISQEKRDAIEEILNSDKTQKGSDTMELNELKTEIAKLSESEKQDLGLVTDAKLAEAEGKRADDAEKETKELKGKIKLMEKEQSFEALLSDGKACEGQREAYMDSDMAKFAEGAVDIKLESKGSGSADDEGEDAKEKAPKTFDEAQDKIVELTDAHMKENKDVNFADAHKIVLSDNPELEKLMEAM